MVFVWFEKVRLIAIVKIRQLRCFAATAHEQDAFNAHVPQARDKRYRVHQKLRELRPICRIRHKHDCETLPQGNVGQHEFTNVKPRQQHYQPTDMVMVKV
ncbi:hypothetical protein DF038_07060 [Burkholderia cepacia]|nr:hypothetical protein DF038_07060 [Burkholderia cepacia]